MTTKLRAAVLVFARLFGAVGLLAALSPAGASAAAARISHTSGVPLVLAAGDRVKITATVVGNGKRIVVGMVFGSAKGAAGGGLRLGAGRAGKFRGTRRVVIDGYVPATVTQGVLGTLLVCINPAEAVKGKSVCLKVARIATSGASAVQRIAGARLAGRLSSSNAILYGLFDLTGDKRVPVELRAGSHGSGGEHAAIMFAASSLGSLPLAIRREAFPYFVPPQVGGSAWQVPGRNFPLARRAAARAAASAAPDCSEYDTRSGTNSGAFPWTGVPTSDGHAIVWYSTTTVDAFKGLEAKDRASAYLYARELPKIWARLTKEFGQPISDAGETCFHGPDGRLDVYVDGGTVGTYDFLGLAVTVPYPTGGASCTNRPSWIAMRNGLAPWVLAHEFMHVLQFSHRYRSCGEPLSWWDEGQATWAGDFVYPDDNTEQRRFPGLVATPLAADLVHYDYRAWPFWMMLQRTLGTSVLRSIFTQLQTKPSVQAVNAAIPGGFARQIPRFFLSVWNQPPVGNADFTPFPKSFKAWDKWEQTPDVPAALTLKFNSATADQLLLPIQRNDRSVFPPLSLGAYHHVYIPDNGIKQITFINDLAGKPGAHVDAMLHLADGTWKLADWTSKQTVALCRDNAAENVREMVIVSTNASVHPLGSFDHVLRASATCPLPLHYTGNWTRIVTHPFDGSWTETITGTATFARPPYSLFPQFLDGTSQIPYPLVSATVHWTMSGEYVEGAGGPDTCTTTYSGGGTESVTPNPSGSSSEFGIEDISGREQPPTPRPEPTPFYYSADVVPSGPNSGSYHVHKHCTYAPPAVPPPDTDETDYASETYLHIGYATTYRSPYTPPDPPDYIQKSATATPLSGHHFEPSQYALGPTYDDTWSFTGTTS